MLTGKTRFRVSFFGKLVLQVEYMHTSYDAYGGPERKFPAWRDATIEDLTTTDAVTTINLIKAKA